jgi:hypothetical protein
MSQEFTNDYSAYKSEKYPCRTVMWRDETDKSKGLRDVFALSYEFSSKQERDFVASQFEKNDEILKVHLWEIEFKRGKHKGNMKKTYYVSIYWDR